MRLDLKNFHEGSHDRYNMLLSVVLLCQKFWARSHECIAPFKPGLLSRPLNSFRRRILPKHENK